jgi:hypothetical protein
MSKEIHSIAKLFSEKQREIFRYWLRSIPAFFYRNNLSKLARLYGTDKYEHGYTKIYSTYFEKVKHKKLRILEIGIGGGENTKFGGNSLKMWAKYFPKSEILGIDIYDKSLLDYRRIKTFQGSQSDKKFLSQFDNLDIIIDDGSHINSDVIKSFEVLFPILNVGGYYCIEDTQVSGSREFTKDDYPETVSYFKGLKLDNSKVNFHNGLVIIKKMN